ncbi:MAG: ribonuclease domain-containing protein [Rhodanobacter sp.]
MHQLKPLIVLAIIVLAVMLWNRHAAVSTTGAAATTGTIGADSGTATGTTSSHSTATTGTASTDSATANLPAFLPPQARDTLALIARGGPFPHSQDGVVFGNYEHLLPEQPRGYYHEYTVETPGAGNRGARRIITGGTPPVIYYYTDDHYHSFRDFQVTR